MVNNVTRSSDTAFLPQRATGGTNQQRRQYGKGTIISGKEALQLMRQQAQTMVTIGPPRKEASPRDLLMRASVTGDRFLGELPSADRVDLTTKQGNQADKNAITAGALLIASQGRDTRMIIENPADRARLLMSSLEQAISTYDHSDKEHQKAMSYIAGQLKKSWSPPKGGVGHYKDPEGATTQKWDPAWDKLEGVFKSGSVTEEHKQQLIAMCQFFGREAESHYSTESHPMVQRINQIQFGGTLGQILEDFLASNTPASQKLAEAMDANGIVDADTHAKVDVIRKRARAHDLLSEVSNKDILAAVVEQLSDQENAQKIKALLKKEISQGSLDDKSYQELIDQVYDRYVQKVGEIDPKTWISGGRGRGKGNHNGNMVSDVNSKNDSHLPVVMPDHKDNNSAMEAIAILFGSDPEVSAAIEAIENGALDSDYVPKTITRLNSGLSSALKRLIYDQPGRLLREAAKEITQEIEAKKNDMAFRRDCRASGRLDLLQKASEKIRVLEKFRDNMGSPSLHSQSATPGISGVIGGFKVPYNKSHGKLITLKDFAEKRCAVGLMALHHLRTLCGPSGTTVDTLLGLIMLDGEDAVKRIVEPLYKHVEYLKNPENFDEDPLLEAEEFKTFFAALSTQMQGGQYHTVSEVLTGMYIVAMALQNLDDDTYFNLEESLMNEDLLLQDFEREPGKYFPVTSGDVAKAERAYKTFVTGDDDDYSEFSSSSSDDDDDLTTDADDDKPNLDTTAYTVEDLLRNMELGELTFR